MSSKTIKLTIDVTREADDSFSIGLEDPSLGDDLFVDGLSEGAVFDPAEAAALAGRLVKDYIAGNIDRIAVPMDFKKSDS